MEFKMKLFNSNSARFFVAMFLFLNVTYVTSFSQSTLNSVVTITPSAGSTTEGAEMFLEGAGSYTGWVLDNYYGMMRLWNHDNNMTCLTLQNSANNISSIANGNAVLSVQSTITNNQFPVTAYGADPTGATSSDVAFSNAITAAQSATGGGGVVVIPSGQYRLNNTYTIPPGVTLQGNWLSPHTTDLSTWTASNLGTILNAYTSSTTTPFISLGSNAAIKGLTIYYPNQTVSSVQKYAFTISGGNNAHIEDVTLVNSDRGIKVVGLSHYIRNVNMCALDSGIVIDGCSDIGRLENVNIHPRYWWSYIGYNNSTLQTYIYTNLTAFAFYYTDWECVTNCNVYQAKIGILLAHSSAHNGDPNLMWTQGGCDECVQAVTCNSTLNPHGTFFSNAMFVGQHLLNAGPITYTNCDLIGNPFPRIPGSLTDIIIQNNITNNAPIVINNSRFFQWSQATSGKPCINITATTAGGACIVLTGCYFVDLNKLELTIATGGVASVTSCIFPRPSGFLYNGNGNVVSTGNIE